VRGNIVLGLPAAAADDLAVWLWSASAVVEPDGKICLA
jgi:hypothetical protein